MTTIATPLNLWQQLRAGAGLELRLKGGRPGRDADIEDALRLALSVPPGAASLEAWLVADAALPHPTVTTEQLLVAVLESQGGFARMMQDILDLLVTAEAKQASHRLSVAFKFDDVSAPIKATLEQFREAVDRVHRVLEKRPELPNNNLMWPLSRLLGQYHREMWTDRPKGFPTVPTMTAAGHVDLDAQLACVYLLLHGFRVLGLRLGATRKAVYDAGDAIPITDPGAGVLRGQLSAAHNYWDIGVLAGAQALARQVASGQLDAGEAAVELGKALEGIEWGEQWVEHTVRELLDLLNLPAWRRRHELYSVWVGTRMLRVIEAVAPDMHFHPVDGVLSFEFGGSRLATFSWDNKQFDIWAELRSALVGISAKRKKGIQPDFRILQPSLALSLSAQTTYVLECKHYLNASTANFTQAAADYARSCPNAVVHVVNHGPADEAGLNALLPAGLQSRARFIGDATPQQEAAGQALSKAIRDALFPRLPPPAAAAVPAAPATASLASMPSTPSGKVAHIYLLWDASLADMDLALRVIGAHGQVIQSIDFRTPGALGAPPFALFDKDVREGPGIECIFVGAWHFSRYELVATNFSRSGRMTSEALYCNILSGGGLTELRCLDGLPESCYEWKIAEIQVAHGVPVIRAL
jgi:hypothetical protein